MVGHCLSSNAKYVFFPPLLILKILNFVFLCCCCLFLVFLIYSLLYQDNLCQLQQSGKLSRDEIHWKICRTGSCKHRLYHHQNSVLKISVDYIEIDSQSPKEQGLNKSKRQKETGEGKVQFYNIETECQASELFTHKRKTNVSLWKKCCWNKSCLMLYL